MDIAWDEPRTVGRFFYHTLPLPQSMTQGKTSITIGINSMGRIWGYGTTAAQYYKPLAQPTRGVYRVYSHTTPFFTPTSDDVQGTALNPSVRTSPGSEVMTAVSARVTSIVNSLLAATPSSLDLWSLVSAGSGSSKLINRNSGKVLGIANNSNTAGAVAQQQSDSGSTSQQWSLVSVGSGYSKFVNRNSDKVLEVANNSNSVGAIVQQWPDNGGANQQWSLVATL